MKKLISLLLCIVMCLGAVNFTAAASDTLVDSGLPYTDAKELISTNPGRGQTDIGYWTVCKSDGTTPVLDPKGAYNTAMYDLRAFSAGNDYTNGGHGKSGVGGKDIPINAQTLDAIAKTLANARHNGAEMAFRFAYAWDGSYGNEPDDFNMMLYHIKQLSDVLNEYADIVIAVECGMAGPWGEMHSSKYSNSKYMSQIIGKWLDCLVDEIGLQVRSPLYMLGYYGITSSDFMALLPWTDNSDFRRIGMFNDGYLGTDIDYGTYSGGSNNLTRNQAKEFLKYAEYIPYGGELAYVTEAFGRANSIIYDDYNIVEEFYLTHLSYLRNIAHDTHTLCVLLDELKFTDKYDFEGMPDISEYYGETLRKFMYDHMGYRFVLRESKLTPDVAPGGELHLKGKIENTGFGNVFRDKETEILLYSKGRYYSCPVELNAKTDIKSTKTYEYDFTLVLPKGIPAGKYEVFMRMSGLNDDLSRDTVANIAFANEGVYLNTLGANRIGNITVSGEAVSENEYFRDKTYNVNGTATPTVVAGNTAKVEAEFGDKVSLAYFTENAYDMCYYVNGNKVETVNGVAEITMSESTIGTCSAVWKDSKGKEHKAQFLTLNVKGHNYKETSREDATCLKEGRVIYTCADCGETVEAILAKSTHSYKPDINDTKCASVCEVCGDSVVITDYDDGIKGKVVYDQPATPAKDGAVNVVGSAIPAYTFSSPNGTACFAVEIDGIKDKDAVLGGLHTVTRSSAAAETKDSGFSGNMKSFTGFPINGDGGYICAFNFVLVNWNAPYNFGNIYTLEINDPTAKYGKLSEGLDTATITPIGVFEGGTFYDVYFCDEKGNVLEHKKGTYSLSASGTGVEVMALEELEELYTKETPAKASEGGKVYTFKGWKTAKGDPAKYAIGTMVLVPDFESAGGGCGHAHITETNVDPTCTKGGYHKIVCNHCGGVILNETIKALGHEWESDYTIDKEPNCTDTGIRSIHCARCNLTKDSVSIPALGHSPAKEWTVDTPAACTDKGSKSHHCTRCDAKSDVTDIAANGHSFGQWEALTSPDCNNSGTRRHTCSICNFAESQIINPLGHDYDTEWTVDIPAAETTPGSKSHHCKRCGDKTDITEIPVRVSATAQFKDVVPDEWYVSAVQYAMDNSLFFGVSDNEFAPDAAMNRAMLVTVLWRAEGKPTVSAENKFTDVPAGEWYTSAVIWASKNGVVYGTGNVQFSPEDEITREQMAAILYRYAKKKGYDITASTNLNTFPDSSDASAYARDALSWACGAGLIFGSDGKLLPQDGATRAQVAAILMRYTQKVVK